MPTIKDIETAARRLNGTAVRTPLIESPLLNERLGGRLLVKAEPLQRTGSFKFRGAFNRLSLIEERDRVRGVVAYSSGNHAQGVAAAARLLGIQATIVMPDDAPAIKQANTRSLGAEIVPYRRFEESREEIGATIMARTGATLIKPYDDPGVIAGQGTVGLEIADQLAERGIVADAVVCCVGGGGLIAGISTALADRLPGVPVLAAEPLGFEDTLRSLEAGERLTNQAGAISFCDALLAPTPGEITFRINRERLAGGVAVSDGEVAAAMRAAFADLKLVVEPGGAAALAAVVAGHLPITDRTVVAVATGGNVDPDLFAEVLSGAR